MPRPEVFDVELAHLLALVVVEPQCHARVAVVPLGGDVQHRLRRILVQEGDLQSRDVHIAVQDN